MTSPPPDDLDRILLRIAAGARVVAAAWVGILVIASYLVTREEMIRPWLPIATATAVGIWSMISVGWTTSRPGRLVARGSIAVDVLLASGALFASATTGSGVLTYSGGLPLIAVAIAAIRGRREAWVAAALMTGVTLVASPSGTAEAVGSIVFYAAGAGIFTWVVRVLRTSEHRRRDADERRRAAEAITARTQERIEISRHLHDSVLQTLALIQRRSDAPPEITVLARTQERELRQWLFDATPPEGTFVAALTGIAAEVEARHSVPIEVVTSGDGELNEAVNAVIAAAGEAMTNAATHSGADLVTVFGEVTPSAFRVFVRDRGRGFDPARVSDDRHGVKQSIVGRLTGRGGSADVRSEPGWGTEWRLEVPR
ncbi:MAG TPA: ATP-binding protein [Acidimicrobiia bacterium]|nr:ATP-binding protein [Acidimicrobiia bacterium]